MRYPLAVLLLSLAALSGCAVQPTHSTLDSARLPPLVPVRDFVANIHYQGDYRISPDGRRISWRQVKGVREDVFVRSLDNDDTRSLGFNAQRLHTIWAQDSRRLLLIKDAGGNENFHLYLADSDRPGAPLRDLTPLDNTRVGVQQIIADDPAHILIVHNHRDKAVFDLYRLNLDSGALTLLQRNPGDVSRWVTDRRGKLHARVRQSDGTGRLEIPSGGGDWSTVASWSQDDDFYVLAPDADGTGIWAISNRGRDKRVLVRLDLASGEDSVVYGHPEVDVSRVDISRVTQGPALAYVHTDYPRLVMLDPSLPDLSKLLPDERPRWLRVSSADDAEQWATLTVDTDRGTRHHLYDRAANKTTYLGSSPSWRFAEYLSDTRPVQLRARDGLTLHGYLTIPQGTDGRKLPMVLLVHGGPFARYVWGYDRQVQFLANRGYAVLQVNYRGSTGYGRAFTEAAHGEFAGTMQDDLMDALQWAVDQGIADPARVAIVGRSYGGYATLVGLTRDPDAFACGIAVVPPSDLVSLSEDVPAYWRPFMYRWRQAVGDPADPTDRARMAAKSPINHVHRLKAPVLIVQGANDVRVKQDQADRMVDALRAAGKPVEYLLIDGEGHHIRHWKNQLRLYRATEDFLARCLGGRSSGFDYFQLGSWLF